MRVGGILWGGQPAGLAAAQNIYLYSEGF